LSQKARWDEALECFREATALRADYAEEHWNKELMLLSKGEFQDGWREYEWRLSLAGAPRIPRPRWEGQNPAGSSIMLFAEGGFGDVIQFIRYAPMLAKLGATVFLECHQELVPLLGRVNGIAAAFGPGQKLPTFDWSAPLQSLPRLFRTTLETVPRDVPYVSALPQRAAYWRQRLARDAFKVGLVWAGNPVNPDPRSRSLELFAPLADIGGVSFYGLQKSIEASQPVPRGMQMAHLGESLTDFAETAAVAVNMDLIISVDTSTAHLAGALGVPVWTLIPSNSDFRWLRDREDSPWYPTMRLFRQRSAGNWTSVIDQIGLALSQRVEAVR
jgi:hypothetical protein